MWPGRHEDEWVWKTDVPQKRKRTPTKRENIRRIMAGPDTGYGDRNRQRLLAYWWVKDGVCTPDEVKEFRT